MKLIFYIIAILQISGIASVSYAEKSVSNIMVLGVIVASDSRSGVALVKNTQTGKTFAVKEGSQFSGEVLLSKVNRKSVELVLNSKRYTINVGDDTAQYVGTGSQSQAYANVKDQIDKDGDTIRVSSTLKDQLITEDLSKVLMQAAAVPQIVNGKLQGFQLWEIEANSVFDAVGLKDGDLVTSINGYKITDVGSAIKQLNSLKNAPNASFDFTRNGQSQKINIVVQ